MGLAHARAGEGVFCRKSLREEKARPVFAPHRAALTPWKDFCGTLDAGTGVSVSPCSRRWCGATRDRTSGAHLIGKPDIGAERQAGDLSASVPSVSIPGGMMSPSSTPHPKRAMGFCQGSCHCP
jgi:hypothetical protein